MHASQLQGFLAETFSATPHGKKSTLKQNEKGSAITINFSFQVLFILVIPISHVFPVNQRGQTHRKLLSTAKFGMQVDPSAQGVRLHGFCNCQEESFV